MMAPTEAERVTGYVVGVISPFGQRRLVPTTLDEAALAHPAIYCNGGGRGLQVLLDPAVAARLFGWMVAPLAA